VIRATAEMLTTKSPEVAMDDLQAGQQAEAFEQARGASEQAASDLKETQRRFEAGEVGEPEVQAAQQRAEEAQRSFDEAAEALTGEAGSSSAQEPRPGEQKTSSEGGFLDVGGAAEAGERIAAMARMLPAKALGHAFAPFLDNPLTKWLTTGLSEKLREKNPELGDRVFAAEANARRNESRWSSLQRELGKTAGRRLPELETMRWTEATDSGWEPGFQEAQVQKETALQQLFNTSRREVSDEARAALEAHDAATYAIRERAHDLGVKVRNSEGEEVPINRVATKDVLTRQFTMLANDAILRGEGRLYRGIIDAIAKVNKLSPEAVEQVFADEGYTEARSIKRRDPIELIRRFKYLPDHIRDASTGEVVKILETNLLRHGKAMLDRAAKRLGVYEEFGPDQPVEPGTSTGDAYAMACPCPTCISSTPGSLAVNVN
jgi:hypothetical protein